MADSLPLSPDDVSEIVAILSASGYDRLDIATDRFRLRVTRAGTAWQQEWQWTATPAVAAATGTFGSRGAPISSESVASAASPLSSDGSVIAVVSPLPGTFYRAPQPGAPPFVKQGDSVTEETVLAIVETMKLMNAVYAGARGTITSIVVPDGALIEAQSALMYIALDAT